MNIFIVNFFHHLLVLIQQFTLTQKYKFEFIRQFN